MEGLPLILRILLWVSGMGGSNLSLNPRGFTRLTLFFRRLLRKNSSMDRATKKEKGGTSGIPTLP